MPAPASPLADATAAASAVGATVAGLTLNEWAALAAIVAALASLADRFGVLPTLRRHRRDCPCPDCAAND